MIDRKKRCDARRSSNCGHVSFALTNNPVHVTGVNQVAHLVYLYCTPISIILTSTHWKKGYLRMLFGNPKHFRG